MVAGIPNVGKSTFINSFAGRASTKTGNKPGVTRGKQWIRLGGDVELLDTPGILWPKFDNQVIGMRLALVGAIRDEILDKQELAVWLINYLQAEYPGALQGRYLASEASEEDAGTAADPEEQDAMLPPGYALLLRIARARSLLMKGGEPDADRAAAMLIDDCKNGRIGRISLDRLQDAEQMEEERLASAAARKQEKEKENEEARKKAARSAGSSRSAAGKSSAGGRRPAGKSGDSGRRPAGKSVDGRRGPAGKNGDSSRRPARKDNGAGRGKSGSSRRRGT
jgi:ribosome biogenesis GTPase A